MIKDDEKNAITVVCHAIYIEKAIFYCPYYNMTPIMPKWIYLSIHDFLYSERAKIQRISRFVAN